MANNGIYYSSGNTLNFTTNNTTWATLTSGGTFVIDTISGGTYLNYPTSSGGTSGDYLPLSGGTVTGGTIFQSGVTANTISQTSYIDFTTGSTNPAAFAGRVFFDNVLKALSYYDVVNSLVPIAMGQQLYIRVYNATGVQIDKGKVIAITGTSNSLPSAILAVNNHAIGSDRPIGVAAENIPNGSEGLVLNNGILSGITLNTFANGDTLYLSDTVPGGYVSSTSSLSFSARTNEIGYVLQTGSTTGKIYVNINNEDSNLTLTDIERNILEGNVISSGVYEYTGMTIGTGATINVAQARGWIVRNTYEFATLPDVTNLYYTGGTNIPLTNLATADSTFILINSASTLVQQTTFPTPQQRRENIFLGKVVHPSRNSITSINQTVDFDVSPMAALRDLWTPLKLINQGVIVSPHSTTLEIDTSAGTLWGNGIGWTTNQQNPDSVSISGTSPTTFQYRTQLGVITGGTVPSGNTTTIDPGYYDLNGVVTAVGGGSNASTNQRVYLFPTGLVRIQLGQQVYSSLSAAVTGALTEQFVEYSLNRENGILIGIISLNKNASVGNGGLVNTNYAVFNFVSKFGEVLGGTGGLSTTTLQQAYDNSTEPEILINSTLDGLSIQNGTGGADNVTSLLQGKNTAGTVTSFIRADGAFSGTSIFGTGLTATTVSATTYQNLPTDIRTTGASYSNNTFTFTNNTGGTYSVLFNTVTGLTVNGILTVTGNTSLQSLTATTISATTYQNVPVDRNAPNVINYITKWYNTFGYLTDSQIYDDGTFVGVGKISPIVEGSQFGVSTSIEVGSTQFVDKSNSIGITDTKLTSWQTGGNEIAIGYGSPLSASEGSDNIAIGYAALQTNSSGLYNVAIGTNSLLNNQAGQKNVAIGHDAATNITSGSYNVAIGPTSLSQTDVGGGNVAIGDQAGEGNIGGNSNIYIGTKAGEVNANGSNNVVIGSAANQSGSGDTSVFLGYSAGFNAISNNSVFIGPSAGYNETSNQRLHIANSTTKTLIYGEFDNDLVKIGGTLSATTYQNLPTDVFVSAGTYSNGQLSFTNTTGGTFSVNNIPIGGAGGQPYYLNLSVSQTPYQEFAPSATTAAEQTTGVTIASGVTTTIANFLTPTGYPNVTLIPAGIWSFYLHSYKANSSTTFDIFVEVYKRTTGGTETLLVSTDPTDVNSIGTASMEISDTYYSGTSLSTSDRILVKVRATNTGTASSTITFVTEGTDHYSYGVTPFTNTSNVNSVTASDGLSGNSSTGTITIINTDKGSSQNIFKNIQAGGVTQFSAGSNSSDLNFSGINITITSAATNTLVFSAGTGGGGAVSSVTAGSGLSGNSTTGAITLVNTGVTEITAGTNITINQSTGNVTINSTGGGAALGTVYTTANNFNFL